jgi:hypothetical protein
MVACGPPGVVGRGPRAAQIVSKGGFEPDSGDLRPFSADFDVERACVCTAGLSVRGVGVSVLAAVLAGYRRATLEGGSRNPSGRAFFQRHAAVHRQRVPVHDLAVGLGEHVSDDEFPETGLIVDSVLPDLSEIA